MRCHLSRAACLACVLGLAVALLLPGSLAAKQRSCYSVKPKHVDDAKIVIENSTYADGHLTLAFKTKRSSDPLEFTIDLKEGWSAHKVANEIHAAFNSKLGLDYKVRIEDKRRVKIDKHKGPNFCLMIKDLDVEGLSVRVEY